MFIKSTVAVALFASSVAAQTTANSTIDPSTVDLSTRSGWCAGEYSTCSTLCDGDASTNDCFTDSLKYSCICRANSSAPGLEYYTQTLPTFICQQIYDNCIKAHENDKAGQDLCTKNRKANCGTLNPDNYTSAATETTSSSVSTAATATSSGAAAGTAPASTSSSTAAAATMAAAREFGTGVIAVGIAAAFGLIL